MSFESIPGWCNFEAIYDRMIATMPIGANVVEVGAWLGRSTAYLARACQASGKNIRLSVVDTWEGSSLECMYNDVLLESKGSVFDQFRRNMEAAEVWNHLVAIKSTSVEAAKRFPNNGLDFVFIDAAHDFYSVVSDIRAWWPKIRIGGWIGGHDFGMWNGVTQAVQKSFSTFEAIPSATSWLLQKNADSDLRLFQLPPKIGVVTPSFRPDADVLLKCMMSVYTQSMPCVHYLIGDGEPVRIPNRPLYTRTASIPGPHRDTGNAARAVGCTLAIAEGCDAIAFLDADNWYMPQHLEVMLSACVREKAFIASSGRTLHALDGSVLGRCPDVDGKRFVDTNCMFFMRPAFGLLNSWARIPESLKLIGDRVVWSKVIKSELPRIHVPAPSVCYRTMYRQHYAMFQKPIPSGAKVLKEGPDGIELAVEST
jgi:predicted O-methyltransferase YrrM